jgi:hypothetical protein
MSGGLFSTKLTAYVPKILRDPCPERDRIGAGGPTERSMRNATCQSRERSQRRPLKMITMARWHYCLGVLTRRGVSSSACRPTPASLDRSIRVCRNSLGGPDKRAMIASSVAPTTKQATLEAWFG